MKKIRILSTALVIIMGGSVFSNQVWAGPKYKYIATPLEDPPSTSERQANAICNPRAYRAAMEAGDRILQRSTRGSQRDNDRVEGYSCDSFGYDYGIGNKTSIKCQRDTSGENSLAGAILGALGKSLTRSHYNRKSVAAARKTALRVGRSVFLECMAEHDWEIRRVCIDECK